MAKIIYNFSPLPRYTIDRVIEGSKESNMSLTSSGLLLLLAVADWFNWKKLTTPYIRNQKLMDRTGLSKRSLLRGREQLVKSGIMTVSQEDDNPKSDRWAYAFTKKVLGFDPEEFEVEVKNKPPETVNDNASPDAIRANPDAMRANPVTFKKLPEGRLKPRKARTREDWEALDQSKKSEPETDIRIINNNINYKRVLGSQKSVADDSSDLGLMPDRGAVDQRDGLMGKMLKLLSAELTDGLPKEEVRKDETIWRLVMAATKQTDLAQAKTFVECAEGGTQVLYKNWIEATKELVG